MLYGRGPSLQLYQTNLPALERFKTIVGAGGIYPVKARAGCMKAWVWSLGGWPGPERVLRQLLPFLLVKREQAEVLLDLTEWHCKRQGGRLFSEQELGQLAACELRLKALKHGDAT